MTQSGLNKKYLFLILILSFLAYANTLFNGFIGDDHVIFAAEGFYSRVQNLPKLFHEDFIVRFSNLYSEASAEKYVSSGCVSYRPMTALSFFMGYLLFQMNPLGHHAMNLLLHLMVTVLVYYGVHLILKKENVALFSALLFGVHPINAEVVNCVGYRSDLLCALFFLGALVSWVKYRQDPKKFWFMGSLICFFLALFSKESAVSLFFVMFAYDLCFSKKENRLTGFFAREYLIFLGILIFYLYVYFFVFPNSAYTQLSFSLFWLSTWIFTAAKILYIYLVAVFLPFKTTVLPPLYCPAMSSIRADEVFLVLSFLVFCGWMVVRKSNKISFFILWFFLTYLPVANLIPLPNSIAFRFMYIPVIGLLVAFAYGAERGIDYLKEKMPAVPAGFYIKFALIGLCLATTIPLNVFFKNDMVCCTKMISDYPDSAKPHYILGMTFLSEKEYPLAIEHLNAYLAKERPNPFYRNPSLDYMVYTRLGTCYVDDPDTAIAYFQKAVGANPHYEIPYVHLAKAYIHKQDYESSLSYALKAIGLKKDVVLAYVYGVHSAKELGKFSQAKQLLSEGLHLAPADPNLVYLKNILK